MAASSRQTVLKTRKHASPREVCSHERLYVCTSSGMADERKVQPQVMYGSALQTRSAIRSCGYTGLDVLLTMYYDPMPDWQLLQLVQYNNGLARDHLGNQSCIELAAEILDDADRCPMK